MLTFPNQYAGNQVVQHGIMRAAKVLSHPNRSNQKVNLSWRFTSVANSNLNRTDRRVAIYVLLDRNADTRYVGRSADPEYRFKRHQRTKLWAVSYEVIEWTTEAECNEREIYWIKQYRDADYPLVNMTRGGAGIVGLSAEGRSKIARALTGKKLSPETKAKISQRAIENGHGKWMQGRKLPQPTRDKIGNTQRGRKRPPEIGRRISAANKGRIISTATREKISATVKKGLAENPRAPSEAVRAKIAATLKGHSVSSDTRAKISASLSRYFTSRRGGFKRVNVSKSIRSQLRLFPK